MRIAGINHIVSSSVLSRGPQLVESYRLCLTSSRCPAGALLLTIWRKLLLLRRRVESGCRSSGRSVRGKGYSRLHTHQLSGLVKGYISRRNVGGTRSTRISSGGSDQAS